MRWAVKRKTWPTERYKIKFAVIPKKTNDGMWVWLEKYLAYQEFLRVIDEFRFCAWFTRDKYSMESTTFQEHMYKKELKCTGIR